MKLLSDIALSLRETDIDCPARSSVANCPTTMNACDVPALGVMTGEGIQRGGRTEDGRARSHLVSALNVTRTVKAIFDRKADVWAIISGGHSGATATGDGVRNIPIARRADVCRQKAVAVSRQVLRDQRGDFIVNFGRTSLQRLLARYGAVVAICAETLGDASCMNRAAETVAIHHRKHVLC